MDRLYNNAPTFPIERIRDCQIIIDCSTLLKCRSFKKAIAQLQPYLVSPIIVAKCTQRVIKEKTADNRSPAFLLNSKTALANMDSLLKGNKVTLYGEESDRCENAILHYIVHHRAKTSKRLVLITQNPKLAYDIQIIINSFKSVRALDVEVYRLNPNCTLGAFVF